MKNSNKMKWFLGGVMMAMTMVLSACGDKPDEVNAAPPTQGTASIRGVWVSSYNTLNLSQLPLNQTINAAAVIVCDGTLGNLGNVNGVAPRNVLLQGDEKQGVLQFGHLAYVSATNPLCRDYSKEGYQYQVSDDGMNMTLQMLNYPIVINYTRQQ